MKDHQVFIRPAEQTGARLPRYHRLRRNSIIAVSLVAMVPLVVLTLISYYQDRKAVRAEGQYEVSRILSNTKRTLSFVIEERVSALSLILAAHPYGELTDDDHLRSALRDLNSTFHGFVDLGVIGPDGRQQYYAGPYELKGKDYSDQAWFHEVIVRGAYVSDVFLGYRHVPHFVISIKHERDDGSFLILRSTLDMELINRQIYLLNLDRNTDAFVINSDGILQTASAFYGKVLDSIDVEIPPHSRGSLMIDEFYEEGAWVIRGHAYVEGSQFILVGIQKQQTFFFKWARRRSDVLWFLAASSILILGVVVYGASNLVKQLREADLRRAKVFHDAEYTSKLATIGRMAAGVAHEINNPLAIINENAGLLKDMVEFTEDFPKKEKTLSLVDTVIGSVDRCSKVTHRLLGFARRMDVSKELIDLEHLLKEVVGFQTSEAAHRKIEINYHIAENIPSVESDRGQLQQVFLNLVSNAFGAVSDGGKIDIYVSQVSRGEVSIAIRDNGSGITKQNLAHIFEPFYSTKGEFGTGLGLSITRDIVEKLGGRIEVESSIGEGTTFTVTLTLSKTASAGVADA